MYSTDCSTSAHRSWFSVKDGTCNVCVYMVYEPVHEKINGLLWSWRSNLRFPRISVGIYLRNTMEQTGLKKT